MAECGKGCMPECRYFTTGGCVSPFNCMYKEESVYINSATSGTVIYTGGMNMPDEEMIENLKCVIADISKQCEELQAENAALRERLEKAAELPVKIGDTVYCVDDEDCHYVVETTTVTQENFYLLCSRIKGNPSNAFLSREAAEAWMKELGGRR